MSLCYSLAGAEILGQRDNQEDFFLLRSSQTGGGRDTVGNADWVEIVLCDGMGGHASGEIASVEACAAFLRNISKKDEIDHDIPNSLYRALDSANQEISDWIKDYPSSEGMGCTLIGAKVNEAGLYWVSVGDSLLFLLRNMVLTQVNADHSYVSVLRDRVAAGEMEEDEMKSHPQRNQLLSALVGGDMELIDLPPTPLQLQHEDLLIFATDGLQTLSNEEIAEQCLSNDNPADTEKTAAILLNAVLDKAHQFQDNTAVVCVYCFEA